MSPLIPADLAAAAERLQVPVAAIRAIMQVECRSAGFLPDGRPVILYERHVMYRLLLRAGHDVAAAVATYPGLVNPTPGGYVGGAREHARLALAAAIDAHCAPQAASWGLFQLMGFHWSTLGYDSVEAFVAAMSQSEGAQLDAFCRFIAADRRLWQALKERDWADFARRYNGPAYRQSGYDLRLARAYADHATATA